MKVADNLDRCQFKFWQDQTIHAPECQKIPYSTVQSTACVIFKQSLLNLQLIGQV